VAALVLLQQGQPALHQADGSHLVAAGGVGEGDAELRKPLPKVTLAVRPRLPSRLQHLVSGEGSALLHEQSSQRQRVDRGQRILTDWLDASGAIRQRTPQRVARASLAGATCCVPVTVPTHGANQTGQNPINGHVRMSGC
jgi:hypothetical protein